MQDKPMSQQSELEREIDEIFERRVATNEPYLNKGWQEAKLLLAALLNKRIESEYKWLSKEIGIDGDSYGAVAVDYLQKVIRKRLEDI